MRPNVPSAAEEDWEKTNKRAHHSSQVYIVAPDYVNGVKAHGSAEASNSVNTSGSLKSILGSGIAFCIF